MMGRFQNTSFMLPPEEHATSAVRKLFSAAIIPSLGRLEDLQKPCSLGVTLRLPRPL